MSDASGKAKARVVLLADRWHGSSEWGRRGLTTWAPKPFTFELLLAEPPDAIVVDTGCCDARLVADCWQLRDLLTIPMVIIADGAGSGEVVKLLERGAEDVLTGRPSSAELTACVAAILRRVRDERPGRVPAVLSVDGVEIDILRRVVRRGGGSQSLSRTEFALLLTLLRAGGRVCSYRELITSAWGADCLSATHYLRLYIRYLRQKIEDDPHHPRRIVNVWGTGYRLAFGPKRQTADAALAQARSA